MSKNHKWGSHARVRSPCRRSCPRLPASNLAQFCVWTHPSMKPQNIHVSRTSGSLQHIMGWPTGLIGIFLHLTRSHICFSVAVCRVQAELCRSVSSWVESDRAQVLDKSAKLCLLISSSVRLCSVWLNIIPPGLIRSGQFKSKDH